jgi:hypothetical protein
MAVIVVQHNLNYLGQEDCAETQDHGVSQNVAQVEDVSFPWLLPQQLHRVVLRDAGRWQDASLKNKR